MAFVRSRLSGLAVAGLALALLAGCGELTASRGQRSAGVQTVNVARDGDPRQFGRAEVISRSAEILAEAAQQGDAETLARLERYWAGPDADPDATRQMAERALGVLAERRAVVAPAHREALMRVARRQSSGTPVAVRPIAFPRDDGAHFGAITEWWYINGHLEAPGERFGYEFTLFRVGPVLLWAHVALTDETGQRFRHVREWYPPGRTQSATDRLATRYGAQEIRAIGPSAYRIAGAAGTDARFDLDLRSLKAPLLINGDGTIDMPEGRDSRYYSLTRLDSVGVVRLGGRSIRVRGLSWLDHQWGPFYVSGFRELWDWFSVQADDGTDYNLFSFRRGDGTPIAAYVNQLDADGARHGGRRLAIGRDAWWRSPRTGYRYPVRWTLDLPDSGERIELGAVLADQEVTRIFPFPIDPLPEYWEGRMHAHKILPDGRRIAARAYTETFGFR